EVDPFAQAFLLKQTSCHRQLGERNFLSGAATRTDEMARTSQRAVGGKVGYFGSHSARSFPNSCFACAIFLLDSSIPDWTNSLLIFRLRSSSRLELIDSKRIFSSINRSMQSITWLDLAGMMSGQFLFVTSRNGLAVSMRC